MESFFVSNIFLVVVERRVEKIFTNEENQTLRELCRVNHQAGCPLHFVPHSLSPSTSHSLSAIISCMYSLYNLQYTSYSACHFEY